VTAFETLRDALLNPPILALPCIESAFTLDTDASDHQLGCCRPEPTRRITTSYWLLASRIDERREELLDERERIFGDRMGDT
jgi:RNase H-like domain found in reverse transcriptase